MIVGTTFVSVRVMNGRAVRWHPFSCAKLTRWPDALSRHKLMKGYDDSKFKQMALLRLRVCLDSFRRWGLHRPPSTICSGTGRPVCPMKRGTAPTTKRGMLRDWSTSLPNEARDCTNHRVLYARGLVDQSA